MDCDDIPYIDIAFVISCHGDGIQGNWYSAPDEYTDCQRGNMKFTSTVHVTVNKTC